MISGLPLMPGEFWWMTVLARAAGHSHLAEFSAADLTTFKTDMADLTGVAYGGVGRT